MSGTAPVWLVLVEIGLMHFILPAALTLMFDSVFRKLNWVKPGYMKITTAK